MNKNKTLKAIVMLLVMAILCGLALTSNAAEAADPKTFTVTSATGAAGETVKVEIKTTAETKIANAGLILTWDTTKLAFVKGTVNTTYTEADYGNYNETEKAYMVAYAYASEKTIPAGTVLATVELKILTGTTGSVPLTLSVDANTVTKVATSNVTVVVPATEVRLDKTYVELAKKGDTATIKATVTPANTTDKVVWKSSDEKVVTVKDGVVTAVGGGYATITATAGNAVTSVTVMVPNPITGIKAPETLTLKVGEKKLVELTPIPENPTNVDEAYWETDNKDVVIVNEEDEIVALKEGTATLTYRVIDMDGKEYTAKTKITVVKADEPKEENKKPDSVGHPMGDINIVMYVAVAVLSLGAVATVAVLRKRNLNK